MEDDILSGVDTKGPAGIDATELYASLDPVSYTHLTLPTKA